MSARTDAGTPYLYWLDPLHVPSVSPMVAGINTKAPDDKAGKTEKAEAALMDFSE